jgi:glycosyltransferase involved in cell wall biosynthesis
VTTDTPGCRETVVHGVNGFLVPVKDVSALARAMESFLQDPSLIGPMGLQSRRMAEERFDVRKVNAVILSRMGLA